MQRISKVLQLIFLLVCLTACQTETSQSSQKNTVQASNINVELGLSYLQQGNRSRAKQKLLQAVEQHPSPISYGALAYFYENTHEFAEAENYYQRAISLDPQAGAGHNNYGAFLCRQKQYEAAEKQFLLAVNDPNYLNDAGAYENAGLCALLIPDTTKASQYFQLALQQNPKMGVSLQELAQISYNNQDYKTAVMYVQRYSTLATATASGLALGIKIALKANDKILVTKLVSKLQSQFPKSAEFQQFKNYG